MVKRARTAVDQVFGELKAEGHWQG
jgi:hypothetical protein